MLLKIWWLQWWYQCHFPGSISVFSSHTHRHTHDYIESQYYEKTRKNTPWKCSTGGNSNTNAIAMTSRHRCGYSDHISWNIHEFGAKKDKGKKMYGRDDSSYAPTLLSPPTPVSYPLIPPLLLSPLLPITPLSSYPPVVPPLPSPFPLSSRSNLIRYSR